MVAGIYLRRPALRSRLDPNDLVAHADGVRALAVSLLGDANTADDVVQEACLAALTRPPTRRPLDRAWFVGVVRNLARRSYRDATRRERRERAVSRSEALPAAAHAAEQIEAHRRLVDAVQRLADPYRTAVVLRYFDGLTPREIGARHGVPRETASTWVHRGLAMLRSRLQEGRDDWRAALLPIFATRSPGPIPTIVPVAGATAMSVKNVVAVVAAVLLLVGGGLGLRAITSDSATPRVAPPRETAQRSRAPRAKSSPAEEPAAVASDALLPAPVDLDKCDRELDLFGRIVDEDGRPVAAAGLRTVSFPWRRVAVRNKERYLEAVEGPATRTARDGTFALRLARGAMVDLRVAAEGFAELVLEQCPAGEFVTLTLRRGATVDVTTVDEQGAPVPGVRVEFRADRQFDPVKQDRSGVTDASGHVVFTGVLARPALLRFFHPTLGEPVLKMREIPASGVLTVRETMRAGRTIRGRVTDADTGAPIAGARVGEGWTIERPVTTDADGRFAFPGWTHDAPPASGVQSHHHLAVAAPGYGIEWSRVPATGDVDFALHLGDRVTGRVVSSDGAPVASAYVEVHGPGTNDVAHDSISTRTGADGRFDAGGVKPTIRHTLIAAAPGFGKVRLDFDPAPGARGTVDLGDVALPAARSIAGVATDGDGGPLPNTLVTLVGGNDDRARLGGAALASDFRMTESRRTDDLGRFRFVDLAPGSYGLRVFTAGVPTPPTTRVRLPDDQDLDDVKVKLAGARTLSVLVVDDAGAPLEEVNVEAEGNFGSDEHGRRWPLSGRTDAGGRIAFRGMPAMETTVRAYDTSGRVAKADVGPFIPEGQEVRVVMRRATTIAGAVRDEEGAAVPHLYVEGLLHRDGSDAGFAWGDDNGAFSMSVPAGEAIDLRVGGSQFVKIDQGTTTRTTDWRGELTGVTGPSVGVVLVVRKTTIARDRKLTVVVRDSAGGPMPGLQVVVSGRTVRGDTRAVTDADGRVSMDGLPAEECSVRVHDGRINPRRLALDVPPKSLRVVPEGQEIVITYRVGKAVRGRVVDSLGKPVPRALVDVATDDYVYYTVRCDDEGRYATAALPNHAHKFTGRGIVAGAEVQGVVDGVIPGDAEVTIPAGPPAK